MSTDKMSSHDALFELVIGCQRQRRATGSQAGAGHKRSSGRGEEQQEQAAAVVCLWLV